MNTITTARRLAIAGLAAAALAATLTTVGSFGQVSLADESVPTTGATTVIASAETEPTTVRANLIWVRPDGVRQSVGSA